MGEIIYSYMINDQARHIQITMTSETEGYIQLLGDNEKRMMQVSAIELNEIKCAIEKMQARLDMGKN
jgi:hypothetical protein